MYKRQAIYGADYRLKIESLRVGVGETGIAVRTPLHGRAHTVAVADEDVVTHADFITVVDDRRTRHRQQHAVHQLDGVDIVLQQDVYKRQLQIRFGSVY